MDAFIGDDFQRDKIPPRASDNDLYLGDFHQILPASGKPDLP
jgi:hypothetical protein